MVDSIRHRHQFDQLRSCGRRGRSGPIRITYAPGDNRPAAAFAINKTVGTAVVRNRVRRRLRAQLRALDNRAGLANGLYLVSVRPEAAALASEALGSHLAGAVHIAAGNPSER